MPPTKKIKCQTCMRMFSPSGYSNHFRHERNVNCKVAMNAQCGYVLDIAAPPVIQGHVIQELEIVDAGRLSIQARAEGIIDSSAMENAIDNNCNYSSNNYSSNSSQSNEEDSPPRKARSLLESFDVYASFADQNWEPLDEEELAGVELMEIIHKKRAPLNAYEDISRWRKKHCKEIIPQDPVPRKILVNKLIKRYNLTDCQPFKMHVKLPFSGEVINLVLHNFGAQLVSLLTDPRIVDDDYLFFNDDPLCPPPNGGTEYVNDINTGRAYMKTWEDMVEPGTNQLLLPIIWYIDGAVTGQYDHLPLTALQFTIGILKKSTRDKPWAWRTVGYVPKILHDEFVGEEMFQKSGHMDARKQSTSSSLALELEWDPDWPGAELPKQNEKTRGTLQDFHWIISNILHGCGYIQTQRDGLDWKLQYRNLTREVCLLSSPL